MRHLLAWMNVGLVVMMTSCGALTSPTLTLSFSFAVPNSDGSMQTEASCPADVDYIRVSQLDTSVPMESDIDCPMSGNAVMVFSNLTPQMYTFLIEGMKRDPAGMGDTTTWSAREQVDFSSGASLTVPIVLQQQTGEVLFDFEFAGPANSMSGGMTCDDVHAQTVNITVDPGSANAMKASVPCHSVTTNADRGAITGVSAGTHDFDLTVADSQGMTIWENKVTQQMVSLSNTNEFFVNFQGTQPGSLQLQWAFPNNGSCADVGVMSVQYTLTNPDGTQSMNMVPCMAADNSTSTTIAGLTAGTYSVAIQACNAGGACYDSMGYPTPVGGIHVLPEGVSMTTPLTLSASMQ